MRGLFQGSIVRVISIMRSKGINIEVMGGLTQTDLLKDSKGEKLPPAAALVPVRQIEDLLGYFAGLLSVNRNQVFPIIPGCYPPRTGMK